MGPKLEGVFAMKKDAQTAAFQTAEMYSFVATTDDAAKSRLDGHLQEEGYVVVGTFKTEDDVFKDHMRLVGRYVAGSVFQLGHGASTNILPKVIYDPNLDHPADWR